MAIFQRFKQFNIKHKYSKFVCFDEKKAAHQLDELLEGLVKPHQRVIHMQEHNYGGLLSVTVMVENLEVECFMDKTGFNSAELKVKKLFLEDGLLNPDNTQAVKMNLDNVGRRKK